MGHRVFVPLNIDFSLEAWMMSYSDLYVHYLGFSSLDSLGPSAELELLVL